ncbi:response regulator transcription factor [Clostridium estertheticum]|uniref:response regulator n=1 Tax=Clostridium estertheticum TaxID=238834 RepID=UPI001C6F420E|nr:response regulator transcription factor [Clostridium estertheticum]MBW9154575.1 response regulator transcription factor [Clostridium estertheticum]WLC83816.1 response regulator transcription factor [Clostridium estertheticum]
MNNIKVLIADDNSIIRDGLKLILDMEDNITVIGLASNGDEAFTLTKELKPDVILMDIRMPKCNGVIGTKKIYESYPNVKIIILSTFLEDDYIFEALKYGAKGYLLKDVESDNLAASIRTVVKGCVLIDPAVAAKIVNGLSSNKVPYPKKIAKLTLTARETEIVKLISNGNTNKEISKLLFISEGTVKNHITNILSKLYLKSRTQVAVYAKENNL